MLLLLAGFEAKAAADCTVSAVGVNFGVYDPYITTPDDSVGEITVTCNHLSGPAIEVRYTVTLSTGGSGSYAPRQLRSGPGLLGYNLSSDLARAVHLGQRQRGHGDRHRRAQGRSRCRQRVTLGRSLPLRTDPCPAGCRGRRLRRFDRGDADVLKVRVQSGLAVTSTGSG